MILGSILEFCRTPNSVFSRSSDLIISYHLSSKYNYMREKSQFVQDVSTEIVG